MQHHFGPFHNFKSLLGIGKAMKAHWHESLSAIKENCPNAHDGSDLQLNYRIELGKSQGPA